MCPSRWSAAWEDWTVSKDNERPSCRELDAPGQKELCVISLARAYHSMSADEWSAPGQDCVWPPTPPTGIGRVAGRDPVRTGEPQGGGPATERPPAGAGLQNRFSVCSRSSRQFSWSWQARPLTDKDRSELQVDNMKDPEKFCCHHDWEVQGACVKGTITTIIELWEICLLASWNPFYYWSSWSSSFR